MTDQTLTGRCHQPTPLKAFTYPIAKRSQQISAINLVVPYDTNDLII